MAYNLNGENRPNGFYRIRMKTMLFKDGWQIAYWFQNHWMVVGSDEPVNNVEEVDEEPIDPWPL